MNKLFNILSFLIILFAKIIITSPCQNDEQTDIVTIHVPAPGPGPWKRGSLQNVSWWCNECKSSDKVIVEIIEIYDEFELGDTVFSEERNNPVSGSLNFEVGNNWNTEKRYRAFVFLYGDQLQYGMSGEFRIS